MAVQEDLVLPLKLNFQFAFMYGVPIVPNNILVNERLLWEKDLDVFISATRQFVCRNGHQKCAAFWLVYEDEPKIIFIDTLAAELCMRISHVINSRVLSKIAQNDGLLQQAFILLEELCENIPTEIECYKKILQQKYVKCPLVGTAGLTIHRKLGLIKDTEYEQIMGKYIDGGLEHVSTVVRGLTLFLNLDSRNLLQNINLENEKPIVKICEAIRVKTITRHIVTEISIKNYIEPMYKKTLLFYLHNLRGVFETKALYYNDEELYGTPDDFIDRDYAKVAEMIVAEQQRGYLCCSSVFWSVVCCGY